MNVTLENAITPLMLARLAASAHASAVVVQDATGAVYLVDALNRTQLADPDCVVLLTRAEALGALEESAETITGALRTTGVLL